jgi:hypothetical protein
VCLRLKQLTEQLFPEKVAERRRELKEAATQRALAAKQGTCVDGGITHPSCHCYWEASSHRHVTVWPRVPSHSHLAPAGDLGANAVVVLPTLIRTTLLLHPS